MKTTEEQIELARKFAGRFSSPFTSGALNGVISVCSSVEASAPWQHDLSLLARAETLLAEEKTGWVCEWTKLNSYTWRSPCDNMIHEFHHPAKTSNFCPHCGGRVKVKEQK